MSSYVTGGEYLAPTRINADRAAGRLEIDWAERIDSIKHMNLDRLVLDFEECYCKQASGYSFDPFKNKCTPFLTYIINTSGYRFEDMLWPPCGLLFAMLA